ncbi:MAG: HEAT repeat domain-containing protein [Phycisphaerae bacterium]
MIRIRVVLWVVFAGLLAGCSDEPDRRGQQQQPAGPNAPAGQIELDGLPATVRQLVLEMRRGDNDARRSAVEALGDLGSQAAAVLPELRGYLDDEDAQVRIAAAKSIAQIQQARREQPLAVADVAGEYITRAQQRQQRSVTGIWKTRTGDSVVSPYANHPVDEGLEVSEAFLSRIRVRINESGQAQLTLPVPPAFAADFENQTEIDLVGRCDVSENKMVIRAHRSLGLTKTLGISAMVERPEPGEDDRQPNLLLSIKLTFVGNRDILESAAWLEMIRQ